MTVDCLEQREGRRLHASGVDAYHGTSALDIKPYVPAIDRFSGVDESYEKILVLEMTLV